MNKRERLYELVHDALGRIQHIRTVTGFTDSKYNIAETMAVVEAIEDWLVEVGAKDLAMSIELPDLGCPHGISFLQCDICLSEVQAELDVMELESPQVRDAAIALQDLFDRHEPHSPTD